MDMQAHHTHVAGISGVLQVSWKSSGCTCNMIPGHFEINGISGHVDWDAHAIAADLSLAQTDKKYSLVFVTSIRFPCSLGRYVSCGFQEQY